MPDMTNQNPIDSAASAAAITALLNEGKQHQIDKETPAVISVLNRTYLFYRGGLNEIFDREECLPDGLQTSTLDGLLDFIEADPNHLFEDEDNPAIISVHDAREVIVYNKPTGRDMERHVLAYCRYNPPDVAYGSKLEAERFGIMLQTRFIQTENRDTLLRLVSNMSEQNRVERADDGVSARLTVKTGVDSVDKTVFQNPAYLAPMRTFPEVVQPESPFIVRFYDGLQASIEEADGGAWRIEAIHSIGNYINARISAFKEERPVVVIA